MHKIVTPVIIIIFLFFPRGFCSFEKTESGGSALALGNALVGLQNNDYAIYYNPANLHSLENSSASFFYRNFYGMPEIRQMNMLVNYRLFNHRVTAAAGYYGNKRYAEYQFSLASYYRLVKGLYAGLCINLYSLVIRNYGQAGNIGLNIGLTYTAMDRLYIGMQATNINQPSIGSIKERLPQTFSIGFAYQPLEDTIFLFELFRDIRFKQDYRAGVKYEIIKDINILVGIADNVNSYSLGTMMSYRQFKFEYALAVHEVLGISHAISFGIIL